MTKKIDVTEEDRKELISLLDQEIRTASGLKALEFGSGSCSPAAELRGELEYLACTDKSDAVLDALRESAEAEDIVVIPDRELAEDCYFGRFHLVYTVFGFRELPHLVDEIMRLRRLILKGGKMVIINTAADGFDAECIKQLKRCGFTDITEKSFALDGDQAFLLCAVK